MDFFFENGRAVYPPEIMERITILRDRAVSPDSTLVSNQTIYDDEALAEYLKIFIVNTPYFYSN
ncbi:MAG: hypothetical protein ACYC1U_01585 [Candidatus Aquicultorales bacterium]